MCCCLQVTLALINRESVSVETVAALNGCAAAVLLAWLRLAGPQFYTAALLPDVPSVLSHAGIFAAVLFVLSPILQTLTQSYADETIWAHAILLAVTHVCFHNYGSSNATASCVALASPCTACQTRCRHCCSRARSPPPRSLSFLLPSRRSLLQRLRRL